MFCYNCGCHLSEHDYCTSCGADVSLYKKIMHVSNMFYNEGLERAQVRDLTGAVISLRQSLKFNKNNVEARNLLGLVYFELGEVVAALSEWVISKNLRPEKNLADDYINRLQSNASRLDALNQTVKKYNQALAYCHQESKDLAVIQLKKVLSLNPHFVRAHQLLALIYMDSEQWDKAQRELKRCLDIDRNNTQTLRYMKEAERMLVPDESAKQPVKRKKEEAVRYQSDNEVIIQPLNVKEPKRSSLSTFVNIAIGLLIGVAATYYLIVPAARTEAKAEAQQTITKISSESDAKTIRVQELEGQLAALQADKDALNQELNGYVGESGTLSTIDSLLQAANTYLQNPEDIMTTAANLETISQNVALEDTSEEFQALYRTILGNIGPQLSDTYYTQGYDAYRIEDYATAIDSLSKAALYNEQNVDAWYYLAQSYFKSGDNDKAVETLDAIIERFPDTDRAGRAQREKEEIVNAAQ